MSVSVVTVDGAVVRVSGQAFRETFSQRSSGRTAESDGDVTTSSSTPLATGSVALKHQAAQDAGAGRLTLTHATAAKSALAESILDAEDALTSVHRSWFAPAQRPCGPRPDRVDESTIVARHAEAAVRGVPWFDVSKRRQAAQIARRLAHADIDIARRAAEERVQAEERRLDAWWNALCANDPTVVTEHVNGVFAGESGPRAAALGAAGPVLEVAVLAPGEHVLPAEEVRMGAARTLTIRRASAGHRSELYRQHVAGLLVATARRALAAAPGAGSVRVHVLRSTCSGPYDDVSLLAVAEIAREDLHRADFGLDAVSLLARIGRGTVLGTGGAEAAMEPVGLDVVPGLAERLAELCCAERQASA
ncbi:hypothetical protein [Arthrobacter sp. NEB 688]|uniref:hypothetical protein n=1 Tax=Arthrobacter sp. NEB 688 TaxID=904039 RepID=UPI0015656C64|nr:hypothetical protein [Arthrobacter sp. NEB 688]QKE84420.1 hypothetical protein HL663_11055 [Arthrobacter sp. NEB 688]